MAVNPIPKGYHTITPFLVVKDARRLIDFMQKAFDAEVMHVSENDGVVMHGEVKIGNSILMVAEENVNAPASPTGLYLYVTDTDTMYKKAIAAGGVSIMEPADQFYGDRNAGVKDFAGNSWWIATHIEDVSPEEIKRRMTEMNEKRKAQE
ncbi:MAG: VOC family protein [Ignavibacteria bacterium]|nr:VOC family protein [Ignavibacteria bacterium]